MLIKSVSDILAISVQVSVAVRCRNVLTGVVTTAAMLVVMVMVAMVRIAMMS